MLNVNPYTIALVHTGGHERAVGYLFVPFISQCHEHIFQIWFFGTQVCYGDFGIAYLREQVGNFDLGCVISDGQCAVAAQDGVQGA